MEPAEQVAANLRRLRKERGLTLEALASASGLKYSDIAKIETQGREPRVGTIVKLARGLGVSVAELFAGIDVG
ncbi:MAG TPA: helix-turn-helix transcriptional regulator [Thermoleophilaceae bacterium]|nr:helix-turn-helix transcriptional regulator [Thermoleophilaceae bacterium]